MESERYHTYRKSQQQKLNRMNPKVSSLTTPPLTLYSGSWRRKKQARTSSQWKLPLWVPIFITVMFSVQRLFLGSLDMYRVPTRLTSTESKRQLACGCNSLPTLAGVFVLIKDEFLVIFSAITKIRSIQAGLYTRYTGGGRIWQSDRAWCAVYCEPEMSGSGEFKLRGRLQRSLQAVNKPRIYGEWRLR